MSFVNDPLSPSSNNPNNVTNPWAAAEAEQKAYLEQEIAAQVTASGPNLDSAGSTGTDSNVNGVANLSSTAVAATGSASNKAASATDVNDPNNPNYVNSQRNLRHLRENTSGAVQSPVTAASVAAQLNSSVNKIDQ